MNVGGVGYGDELRLAQQTVLGHRGVFLYAAYRYYGFIQGGNPAHPADAYWQALSVVRDHDGNPPGNWPPINMLNQGEPQ